MFEPGYLVLYRIGELARRIEAAWSLLAPCELCPHRCGVDRPAGEVGVCGMGSLPRVYTWALHHWEEPPLSGTRGSGAVFLSGCTGRCQYCQNYPFSQLGYGAEVSPERLAEMMLELQRKGAHNISFVTPTHFMPHLLSGLWHAIRSGLSVPLVYNTSGYERVEAIRLLEGVVDVWLPDSKYADDAVALRLSGFRGYVGANRAALREMHRQVGDELILDEDGIARRGMIVRHLVLPGGLAGTAEVLGWIASALSPRLHVSLMDQYFPAYRVLDHPQLGRRLTKKEYAAALLALEAAGLENGWSQEALADAPFSAGAAPPPYGSPGGRQPGSCG
jgi:putative pyruvate formate lyase activating enzyme